MAQRKPIVIINGQLQELPLGDELGVRIQTPAVYTEPVVVSGFNADIVHESGTYGVPMFITTSDGDVVCAARS